MLTREWFSIPEIAAMKLPLLPTTADKLRKMSERDGWQHEERRGTWWRDRAGRPGGGVEFHYSVLPEISRLKIIAAFSENPPPQAESNSSVVQAAWERFERKSPAAKATAHRRLKILMEVCRLVETGSPRTDAILLVAMRHKISKQTFYGWEKKVRTRHRSDWLAFLVPHHVGRTARVEMPAEAWAMIRANWLRLEAPAFAECWRQLQDAAAVQGWALPSERTVERRLNALPAPLRVAARKGRDKLKAMYAPQRRDRSVFHAMQALNADGHTWDVFVRYPDGTIGRPVMSSFHDLYSGKMVGWRLDRSLHGDLTRLVFRDVVRDHGLPEMVYFDNGREFANKMLTGRAKSRFRFKIKEEDPAGIFAMLGVEVHFVTPYAGQSKPIERAFRDFASGLAKHPAFAGAYVGNNPTAKPENYGSAAVPLDIFTRIIGQGLAEWNARADRDTHVCQGRSFNVVFDESHAANAAKIQRPTEAQLSMLLMAAESVTADKRSGRISLFENVYWSEFLAEHAGQKLTVRFDPERLQEPLHVYRLDGSLIGRAECTQMIGFNDTAAAREHGKKRAAWMKAQKALLAAEKTMTIAQVAAMLPPPPEPAPVEQKIVRLFSGNVAVQHEPEPEEEEQSEQERRMLNALRTQKGARLRLIEPDEEI